MFKSPVRWQLILAGVAAVSGLTAAGTALRPGAFRALAADRCGGCAALRTLDQELAQVASNDYDRLGVLIDAASDAVSRLPRDARGRLDDDQVRELVLLLISVYPYDGDYAVVQNNLALFETHERDLLAQGEKLEAERRLSDDNLRQLRQMLSIGISEGRREGAASTAADSGRSWAPEGDEAEAPAFKGPRSRAAGR